MSPIIFRVKCWTQCGLMWPKCRSIPSKLSIYVLSLVSLQVRMQNKEEQQRIMASKCVEEHRLTDSSDFPSLRTRQQESLRKGIKKLCIYSFTLPLPEGRSGKEETCTLVKAVLRRRRMLCGTPLFSPFCVHSSSNCWLIGFSSFASAAILCHSPEFQTLYNHKEPRNVLQADAPHRALRNWLWQFVDKAQGSRCERPLAKSAIAFLWFRSSKVARSCPRTKLWKILYNKNQSSGRSSCPRTKVLENQSCPRTKTLETLSCPRTKALKNLKREKETVQTYLHLEICMRKLLFQVWGDASGVLRSSTIYSKYCVQRKRKGERIKKQMMQTSK